ncbi:hypothetical protein BSFA1_47030 [Burkholderia sp. SFA1]|nr:hypothetical protein BSFA1_47030 [Burkholderia sp. SFA1]
MTLVRALFRVMEWSCIKGTIPAEHSHKKGHARMVDDLRFKVDRLAVLSIQATCAGIPPPKHTELPTETRPDAFRRTKDCRAPPRGPTANDWERIDETGKEFAAVTRWPISHINRLAGRARGGCELPALA